MIINYGDLFSIIDAIASENELETVDELCDFLDENDTKNIVIVGE